MIKYYGGKIWLGKQIENYLPKENLRGFCDVFVGGGQYFRCFKQALQIEMIDILTYVGAISQEDAHKTLDLKETEDEVWLLCVD